MQASEKPRMCCGRSVAFRAETAREEEMEEEAVEGNKPHQLGHVLPGLEMRLQAPFPLPSRRQRNKFPTASGDSAVMWFFQLRCPRFFSTFICFCVCSWFVSFEAERGRVGSLVPGDWNSPRLRSKNLECFPRYPRTPPRLGSW